MVKLFEKHKVLWLCTRNQLKCVPKKEKTNFLAGFMEYVMGNIK